MASKKLAKKWGGHKAGTSVYVLSNRYHLQRDGSIVDKTTGETVKGVGVDAQRADQLGADGYFKEKGAKKGAGGGK